MEIWYLIRRHPADFCFAVPAEEADALAEELAGMDIFGGVIGYVTELQDKAVVFEIKKSALLSDIFSCVSMSADIFLVLCILPNCLDCISIWNCYKIFEYNGT